MKKLNLLFLFSLILVLSNVAFAQAKKATSPQNGLLYKITGKGLKKPSYIFGTIHAICPTDLFGLDTLSTYLKQTDRLILELDMDDPQVMQKMAGALNMPTGKTLKDYLSAEKYAKVDEMFKNVMGIPVAALGQFSPFGLSAILSMSAKSTGCSIPASYEAKLVEAAGQAKQDVEGLETVEEQIAAINKTPIEKQAESLFKMSLDAKKSIGQFKQMLAVYKLQDTEKLNEYISKESADDPEFTANLLDERNKKWISRIEKALKEKPTFFAVGGGHLGGNNGVVNLLRQKGYKLTAIKL